MHLEAEPSECGSLLPLYFETSSLNQSGGKLPHSEGKKNLCFET
jgi:hypothetical protein